MTARNLCVALIAILILSLPAASQSSESRPRRALQIAYDSRIAQESAGPQAEGSHQSGLESLIPRNGLFFYIEIRDRGVQEMAHAGALTPLAKAFLGETTRGANHDRLAFLSANIPALSNARLAFAQYRGGGTIGLIEASSEAQAQQLKSGLDQIKSSDVAVGSSGRLLLAGTGEAATLVSRPASQPSVADDSEFMRAYRRFAGEPFFGYLDFAARLPVVAGGADAAYTASLLSGVASMPAAIAFAGSFEGENLLLRAMTLSAARPIPGPIAGLFSSVLASGGSGHPVAAELAPSDSDVFVDVMIDWDKLYEAIGSLATMFAGAVTSGATSSGGGASVDPLATLETQLGFSIKNDLIPTLGSEVAISISGFDKLISTPQPTAGASPTTPRAVRSPRFTAMIALRDPSGFETFVSKFLAGPSGSATVLRRVPYRNTTIVSSKSLAYAVVDGFFVVSGSAGDIRKLLDAHADGSALAARAEFKSVMPDSQAMLQAYIAPSLTAKLFEALSKQAGIKAEPGSVAKSSPIGLIVTREDEQTMIEMRMPGNLAYTLVAAVANIKPEGSNLQAPAGVGIPAPTGPRTNTGPRTPTLTDDDIRRRP